MTSLQHLSTDWVLWGGAGKKKITKSRCETLVTLQRKIGWSKGCKMRGHKFLTKRVHTMTWGWFSAFWDKLYLLIKNYEIISLFPMCPLFGKAALKTGIQRFISLCYFLKIQQTWLKGRFTNFQAVIYMVIMKRENIHSVFEYCCIENDLKWN